jgi:hypothetical protein
MRLHRLSGAATLANGCALSQKRPTACSTARLTQQDTFTLTANQATTVVDDSRCGPDSVILWMPTTANAGGELGIYITNRGVETSGVRGFTVNHATDSRTDRTFAYAIFG